MPYKCKVKCIETGIIYNSMKEAIKDVGLKNDRGIYDSIRNPDKTSAGYHWEYYEEPDLLGEIWENAKHYTFGTDDLIDIPGFLVSNKGRIKNIDNKQILTGKLDKGYIRVGLNGNYYFVHRIVASTFIHNSDPLNKTEVNHKKEDEKSNNDVSNLEWVTIGENNSYGTRTQRAISTRISKYGANNLTENATNSIKKKVICITTNEIFDSVVNAAKEYNIRADGISACCRGESKSYKGKQWKYIEED